MVFPGTDALPSLGQGERGAHWLQEGQNILGSSEQDKTTQEKESERHRRERGDGAYRFVGDHVV